MKEQPSTPGGIRTPNPRFRRPMRYPVAPRALNDLWTIHPNIKPIGCKLPYVFGLGTSKNPGIAATISNFRTLTLFCEMPEHTCAHLFTRGKALPVGPNVAFMPIILVV